MRNVLFLVSLILAESKSSPLELVFEWHEFVFNDTNSKGKQIHQVIEDSLMGEVRAYNNYLYLSVPRLRDDTIPATLNFINLKENFEKRLSPQLRAFPNLLANQIGNNCETLQNVLAMEVSPVGELWVADSGIAAVFSNPVRICPAKLVVFDLQDGGRVKLQYPFPEQVVSSRSKSILLHMVLDYGEGIERPFVYISDMALGHLVVFDLQKRQSWTISSREMKPKYTDFRVSNTQSVTLRSGISGLALETKRKRPRLFFSTFGREIYTLPTSVLKHSALKIPIKDLVKRFAWKRTGSDGMAFDDQGRLYFGELELGNLVILNVTNMENRTILTSSPNEFNWINGMFIHESQLWITSNSFHRYIYQNLRKDQENFKIFKKSIPARVTNPYTYEHFSNIASDNNTPTLINAKMLIIILLVLLK